MHRMDRLARNLDDLRTLLQGLTGKGVRADELMLWAVCDERDTDGQISAHITDKACNPGEPVTPFGGSTCSSGRR